MVHHLPVIKTIVFCFCLRELEKREMGTYYIRSNKIEHN